ncbi:MAG: DUF5670 family protein [Bacteroidota bacterium]
MKNSLYIISGLFVVFWAIAFFGFELFKTNSYRIVHVLLIIAVIIILVRIIFYKKAQ